MNFKNKIFASMIAASMATGMIAGMASPVFAESDTVKIPVNIQTGDGMKNRQMAAYQIFSGTMKDGDTSNLYNIQWGSGIDSEKFLNALSNSFGDDIRNTMSANEVAKILSTFSTENAEKVAKMALEFKKGNPTTFSTNDTSVNMEPGYYLITDASTQNGENSIVNPAILQVTNQLTIKLKTAIPSVDKQVQDETTDKEANADGEGWGESADHAIGETFQFKLTGSIPASTQISRYEKYAVTFNDSYSEGVTYIGKPVVKIYVGDRKIELNEEQYSVESNPSNHSLAFKIDDLKSIVREEDWDKDITITVTYDAKLNENAQVVAPADNGAESKDSNKNVVSLSYSNNPNVSGEGYMGHTKEDSVFVFTYEVPNKKVDQNGHAVANVEFKLYKDEACTQEIQLKYDTNKGIYLPKTDNSDAYPLKSDAQSGQFKIVGLDAGTYYLKETKTPDGYNPLKAPLKIEITANHYETDGGTAAAAAPVLKVDGNPTTLNTIVNNKGMQMPETGGTGTVLIYTTGAALIVGAGVLLVARKKAEHESK